MPKAKTFTDDLRCPQCLEPLRKDGRASSNAKQQYECTKCYRKTTLPVGGEHLDSVGVDPDTAANIHARILTDKSKVRRYVITSAQNATDVNKLFFEALKSYCRVNKSQLIVIPYRYRNPTSMWSEKSKDDDWWAPELAKYMLDIRVDLGKNLVLLADIKTQPTSGTPLQGFETITGGKSGIIGHPKLQLTTIATPQNKLPKVLTTTGSCTMANYTPTKAGKKGEHHHTFGACVVEIKGDVFHMRQINAVQNGSFMELDREYFGNRPPRKVERLAGLSMGDEHEEFIDPAVVRATFGKGGIVPSLRPRHIFRHDVHDFYSRNHHHEHEPFINLVKHRTGSDNVRNALQKTFDYIDAYTTDDTINVFVPSNHPDALAKWMKKAKWQEDYENAEFICETALAMCRAAKMTDTGARTLDPITYWGKRMLKSASQARFLRQDESFMLLGIEMAMHGHQGINGSRGTRKSFGRIGVKSVIGHSHSPGIEDGVFQGGQSARYGMEYVKGPSSALQTHVFVYENGKRSLCNIIGGEWRA